MAIVRGNNGGNAGNGANINWNHNNISTGSGILLCFTGVFSPQVTAVTYAGIVLTLKQQYGANNELMLWFLVGPPTGVNVLKLNNGGAGQSVKGNSIDYK